MRRGLSEDREKMSLPEEALKQFAKAVMIDCDLKTD